MNVVLAELTRCIAALLLLALIKGHIYHCLCAMHIDLANVLCASDLLFIDKQVLAQVVHHNLSWL